MLRTKNIIRALVTALLSAALIIPAASALSKRDVQAAGQSYTFTEDELANNPCQAINTKIQEIKGSASSSSIYTLKLPAGGTYTINSLIKMYSNITLDLNGSTLKMVPNGG